MQQDHNATKRGILFILLAILFFTAMDATARGLVRDYPVPQVIWARFAGQLVVVALILRRRLPAAMRTKYPALHLARSVTQLTTAGLFFLSLSFIGLAEATALTNLSPVLITLGAALFLKETLGPRRIIGIVVAMIGAMIVIRPGASVFTPAALLPLGAAVTYAANALITRMVGPRETPWAAMIYAALFGTVLLGLAQPFLWQPVQAADLPLFLIIGVLGTGGQLFLIRAFSLAEAGVIAPFDYAGLVFAIFWGIALFGEYPDLYTVIGALVISGAGLYVWHRETKSKRAA